MRRNLVNPAAFFTVAVLMTVLTASCDLPQGPGTGTLTLFLASGEGPAFGRSVSGRDFPADVLETMVYELTMTGPSGETLTRTLIGGGPHSLTLTLGAWQLEVRALVGAVSIGTGSSALHLTGGDNRARLSMTLNQGVALARDEAELTDEIWAVAAGGSGVILLTGDIDLNSFIDIDDGKTITLLAAGAARTIRRVVGSISVFDPGSVLTLGAAGETEKLVFDGLGVDPGTGAPFFCPYSGGTLIIDGSTEITGGVWATNRAGAVLIMSGGSLEMRGGKIANCSARYAGAVSVEGGSFIMRGGEISGNRATDTTSGYGGAINVGDGGSFTMEGGVIKNNTAVGGLGGGVYLDTNYSSVGDNTFTMRGGEISGNTVLGGSTSYGGGVCVNITTYDANHFFMEGGLISGNTADRGDGVAVYGSNAGNAFTMTGGLIGANTAAQAGGGVYVYCIMNGPAFAKRGGTLAGDNTAPAGPVAYVDTPPRVRSAEAGPAVRLYWSGTSAQDPLDSFDTGPNWN